MWSTSKQTGHLRALNNALGQLLVLIAVTNLLCDLKTVTYLINLDFLICEIELMTLYQAKDLWGIMITTKPLTNSN